MFLLTTLVMMCKKSDEIIKATKMGLLGKSYDVSAFILGKTFTVPVSESPSTPPTSF